jgi:hypothetical protein
MQIRAAGSGRLPAASAPGLKASTDLEHVVILGFEHDRVPGKGYVAMSVAVPMSLPV